MGTLLEGIGFLVVVSILFLPVAWFAFYFILEAFRWKTTDSAPSIEFRSLGPDKERPEKKQPEKELDHDEKAA